MLAKYEVATLLKHQQDNLTQIVSNSWKYRTLFALMRCRTAAMGGHIDRCSHPRCKKLHLSYNSCRNRHCPKCQGHLKEKWVEAREADLLNCKYFHVVFTLPEELNEIALQNPKVFYKVLFKTAWSVINSFGINPKFLGAKTGMIAVLHTWGQNLSLHPHLHCIVPSGGVSKSGKWKNTRAKGKYLFPVKSMSKVFRARFVEHLAKHVAIPKQTREVVFSKNWVVYAKQPFFGPGQVIEYLGRYSHKIAISNHRIMQIDNQHVAFSIKDYRFGGKKKVITLSHHEFIRRFALHILPKGFTRIRHYGILSSSTKKKNKVRIDLVLGEVVIERTQSVHRICPACKKGRLETIYSFDPRGPPSDWKKLFEYLS